MAKIPRISVNIRMSQRLRDEIQERAEALDLCFSEYIRKVLAEELEIRNERIES